MRPGWSAQTTTVLNPAVSNTALAASTASCFVVGRRTNSTGFRRGIGAVTVAAEAHHIGKDRIGLIHVLNKTFGRDLDQNCLFLRIRNEWRAEEYKNIGIAAEAPLRNASSVEGTDFHPSAEPHSASVTLQTLRYRHRSKKPCPDLRPSKPAATMRRSNGGQAARGSSVIG